MMKTRIILLSILFISLISSTGYAQNQSTSAEATDSLLKKAEDFINSLSDYYVMKVENVRHKVETLEGDDITSEVSALKSPNGLDLVIYDPETDWTSICVDFYHQETPNNEWLPADALPESPTGIYWVLSNDFKSYNLVKFGQYLDMTNFSLKKSELNPSEFIISENGVQKYVMRDLQGKTLNSFYPLELLNK